MGLFDKIRGEFIDIIEWLDPSEDTIVYRFQRYNNEIKYGAKLVVRETQVAIFINEGQFADVFQPGTYTLETKNLPILSTLQGWKYGFNSPFKAEVYFVNTKQFLDKKWGTKNPIMMRDPELGVVRVRAFGNYSFRITDAVKFLKEVVGTQGDLTTEQVEGQIRDIVLTRFTDYIAEQKIPVLDLAANYNELSGGIHNHLKEEIEEYGILITKFLIENISLPPEVEAILDKKTSMNVIGDMNQYAKFQTANAIGDLAKSGGGGESAAGLGMGMGAGYVMANQMGQMFNQTQTPNPQTPPPVAQYYFVVNGQQNGPYAIDQVSQLIRQGIIKPDTLAWTPGLQNWVPASQIPALSQQFTLQPPPIPPQP
ncbi:MAG: SPFH domain-containing protein [Bacteroidales bacterium]|nr:SPFH domain-containing protein [Bacteroidales bacterium]